MKGNNPNKEQIWMTVFTVLPFVMLLNAGEQLSELIQINSMFLSALFGGIGGLVC